MKKFIVTLLVLALLAGIAYGVYFYLMMPPINNLEQAKENLENDGYSVTYYKFDDEQKESLSEYLEKTGYTEFLMAFKTDEDNSLLYVTVYESSELAKIRYDEMKLMIESQEKSIKNSIESYEYELKHRDLSNDERERIEEQLEEYKEELELYKDLYIARWGKTVWYGHKDAIKASRG